MMNRIAGAATNGGMPITSTTLGRARLPPSRKALGHWVTTISRNALASGLLKPWANTQRMIL